MKRISLLIVVAALAAPTMAPAGELVVEVSSIADRKAVFATVESVDVVDARARIGGTVESLLVDEGSEVAGGATIATIGDPKLGLQLVALDARIASLDAQKKLAATELTRISRLRKSGSVSQARLDEARTNLDVVTSSRTAMVAERAVVAERLAEGAVLAPGAGRVLKVYVTQGSVVMPGEPVATIAAERYVLRLELPERHAKFMRKGDEVLVGGRGLTSTENIVLKIGVVSQVYPRLINGRVVADVEVEGLGDYFVGERTRVFVVTGTRQAITIPVTYLRDRFGVTYVQVKGEGEVMIQPGQRFEGNVEILTGLKQGDVLVEP